MNTLLRGAIAGVVATAVKAQAEAWFQPAAEALLPPSPEALERPGADPAGHRDEMPPSQVVDAASRAVTGSEPDEDTRSTAAESLHWAMGIGAGVAYALLRDRVPAVARGRGALWGLAVFGATHATVLPAAGLQAPLTALPRAALVWEPGSHVAYGLAADLALRGTRA